MNPVKLFVLGAFLNHPPRADGFCFRDGSHPMVTSTRKRPNCRPLSSSFAAVEEGNSEIDRGRDETKEDLLLGNNENLKISYPWSEVQDWALKDNLPKYFVRIRVEGETESVLSPFVLWRSLQQDVPELSGYPIDVLRSQYLKIGSRGKNRDSNSTTVETTVGVLPYLQDYEFSAEGGISGNVFGLDGLSDGSRIQTSRIMNLQESLPKGYIQTTDGKAFELGRPLKTNEQGEPIPTAVPKLMMDSVSGSLDKNLVPNTPEDADGLLLRLGATTGIFLAGATAVNMLSHHLTVNVFWV